MPAYAHNKNGKKSSPLENLGGMFGWSPVGSTCPQDNSTGSTLSARRILYTTSEGVGERSLSGTTSRESFHPLPLFGSAPPHPLQLLPTI